MHTTLSQKIAALFWLGGGSLVLMLLGRRLVTWALAAWAQQGWLPGLVWMGLAFVAVVFSLRLLVLVVLVLRGRLTFRLARRNLRNAAADLLFFSRTGMWREF